jgi:hypothetical protein
LPLLIICALWRFATMRISAPNNYYTLQAFSPFIGMILSHSTPNEKNKTFKNRGQQIVENGFL